MASKNVIKKSALAPTIIIAGGAGFVGSHLSEILLQKEARVVVLDNFTTGKEIHVNHLINNPKFALFDVDINQGLPDTVESADYILHLAGLEEYLFSKEEVSLDSLLTNAVGTKNLLDFTNKSKAKLMLASTIDVYEGMMSQVSLTKYFGDTKEDEQKFSLTEAKRYAEALVWEYYKKFNIDVRIVRLPEIYGPRMSLSASGNLGRLVRDLIDGKDLVVYGDGTHKEQYLYINDAVSGMVKALLQENTEGKIFSLAHKEPITVLEAAFLLRSIADRQLTIKFEEQEQKYQLREFNPDLYTLSLLKWEPKTTLKDGLIETLKWFKYGVNPNTFKQAQFIQGPAPASPTPDVETSAQEYLPQSTAQIKDIPKIKKPRKELKFPKLHLNLFSKLPQISYASKVTLFIVVFLSFLAVFIFFPLFNTYSASKKALAALERVPEYISEFNITQAVQSAQKAREELTKAQKYFSSLSWVYSVFGKTQNYTSTSKMLSSVTYFSAVTLDSSKAIEPFTTVWGTIRPNSADVFNPETLADSKLHISDAKSSLQLALADFSEVDETLLPGFAQEGYKSYGEFLGFAQHGLELASAFSSSLPDLLGFGQARKYLILFENNHELRPTGGFIGSYAFLDIKDGKIQSLEIDDIYNPDGQIDARNIKVNPPKPIGDFLAEDRLYIRNANWEPDFKASAATIKDLFYKLDGVDIYGVVSVDLHMVKELLNVTGPIYLAAFNEEITAENLYERTQFNSSYDYEEGSQQKRQFLTVLGSKLVESLFSIDAQKLSALGNVLTSSLEQRHLQLHLFANQLSPILAENNWDGGLVQTAGDYLNVINANLGGTKANYYVKNKIDYEVSSQTRDGLLRGKVVLDYTHTGIDDAWPGGPYKDYVRVLTQHGSKLTGATMRYDEAFEEDIFEKVIISQAENYTSFETSFVLNPKGKVKLTLYYDLPVNLSITKDFKNYSLYWQKQAGTHDDDYTFSFRPPFGMGVERMSSSVKQVEDAIISSGKLNTDFKAEVLLK